MLRSPAWVAWPWPLALAALPTLAVPGVGKLAALSLALFAAPLGLRAFRRTGGWAPGRLLGAAAVAVGAVAFVLAGTKIALTFIAVEHVARLGG